MRWWVQLPQAGGVAGRRNVRLYAALAEELGFTGGWVGDHIVIPEGYTSQYPYGTAHPVAADRPFLEAYTTLAYVAGRTERLRLAVTVAIAPYRHPLTHAKIIATLDELSDGRVEVALGAGWLREEFAALGVDYAARNRLTDRNLEVMRRLWTGDPVTYHDHGLDLDGVRCLPRPVQTPHPPLWLGGSSPRAMQRIAKTGAGWLGPDLPLDEFVATTEKLLGATDATPPVSAKLWLVEEAALPSNSLTVSTANTRSLDLVDHLDAVGVTDIRIDLSQLSPRDRPGALTRLSRQLGERWGGHA